MGSWGCGAGSGVQVNRGGTTTSRVSFGTIVRDGNPQLCRGATSGHRSLDEVSPWFGVAVARINCSSGILTWFQLHPIWDIQGMY